MVDRDLTGLASERRDVYTVAELNRAVRTQLELGFPLMWVEGEVSNLAQPRSGHQYFTLKDSMAQVRCAMFRMRANLLRAPLSNGMQVVVRARVGLYEPRGDYQLIVEHIEESGAGALQRKFDELKSRLAAEGLFDQARKKHLPPRLQRIGVVTSPTGAAIRDILSILSRRAPGIEVVIYPVRVQGDGAETEIANAIRKAGERNEVDALIVGRGGGSLEDLWAFNDEGVARALAVCPLPTVSAVGHEVDVTISDFVADIRAPTPSAAAELLSPDQIADRQRIAQLTQRLRRVSFGIIDANGRHLHMLRKRLRHPRALLANIAQRCDELEIRLGRAWNYRNQRFQDRLRGQFARLLRHDPRQRIRENRQNLEQLQRRLERAGQWQLDRQSRRLSTASRTLDAVSPLRTLDRGYAIVQQKVDRTLVTNSRQVEVGDSVVARLAKGELTCTVTERSDSE